MREGGREGICNQLNKEEMQNENKQTPRQKGRKGERESGKEEVEVEAAQYSPAMT